jgi:hypothetical protein
MRKSAWRRTHGSGALACSRSIAFAGSVKMAQISEAHTMEPTRAILERGVELRRIGTSWSLPSAPADAGGTYSSLPDALAGLHPVWMTRG